MDHKEFTTALQRYCELGKIPEKSISVLLEFQQNYLKVTNNSKLLHTFLELLIKQLEQPYAFDHYNSRVQTPFDYTAFAWDFLRPLIDFSSSTVQGIEHYHTILKQLAAGDNVVLLANHQTEPDPQLIQLLLEPYAGEKVKDMIFVAGHRVTSDPVCVPFSLGLNLLCIYSKKYIDTPPELKAEKIAHNKQTMSRMQQLLEAGGKCIYVAPSGGRDRKNSEGIVTVAPFDPSSIEMFRLMTRRLSHQVHFYPLALKTFDLLPPPSTTQYELGEPRTTTFTPVHLNFGPEIDMENFPGSDLTNPRERRAARAQYIENIVIDLYRQL